MSVAEGTGGAGRLTHEPAAAASAPAAAAAGRSAERLLELSAQVRRRQIVRWCCCCSHGWERPSLSVFPCRRSTQARAARAPPAQSSSATTACSSSTSTRTSSQSVRRGVGRGPVRAEEPRSPPSLRAVVGPHGALQTTFERSRARARALAAPATSSGDAASSTGLQLLLVDSATGAVLHTRRYAGASGPVALACGENWLVHSYWNAAARRPEVASALLLEGAVERAELVPWNRPAYLHAGQASLAVSAFDAPPPFVLHRTFLLPVVSRRRAAAPRRRCPFRTAPLPLPCAPPDRPRGRGDAHTSRHHVPRAPLLDGLRRPADARPAPRRPAPPGGRADRGREGGGPRAVLARPAHAPPVGSHAPPRRRAAAPRRLGALRVREHDVRGARRCVQDKCA